MERVEEENPPPVTFYLPHHEICKPEKSSTKLRIVFNASAPTTTGLSLNDISPSGEVKEDIFDLIVRFRKHKIALVADIKQMFRQILIDSSQRNLLRFLWKEHEDDSPITF
ncbi:uncharacterized protein LOC118206001 [Stegodyphus dumicola]|uniref:uncharacterized protein LOC118206001 n=1 Tax=Stegodyphus dumicola TaxID=202533 RepID=UPI0015B040AE|nr:uncharacterized protein LOC118206001 [Stegodyphus dumicola]